MSVSWRHMIGRLKRVSISEFSASQGGAARPSVQAGMKITERANDADRIVVVDAALRRIVVVVVDGAASAR